MVAARGRSIGRRYGDRGRASRLGRRLGEDAWANAARSWPAAAAARWRWRGGPAPVRRAVRTGRPGGPRRGGTGGLVAAGGSATPRGGRPAWNHPPV